MESNFGELDPIIHSRVRLAVLILLLQMESANFTYLKKEIDVSDGNLSTHLRKLENAEYITVTKKFENRKPQTSVSITEKGKTALDEYTSNLQEYLKMAGGGK